MRRTPGASARLYKFFVRRWSSRFVSWQRFYL
jgi:hypothetical protein